MKKYLKVKKKFGKKLLKLKLKNFREKIVKKIREKTDFFFEGKKNKKNKPGVFSSIPMPLW